MSDYDDYDDLVDDFDNDQECPECGEPMDGSWCSECDYEVGDDFVDDLLDDDYPIDGVGFQDPGGTSSLRRATPSNPRNLPCPTCKEPNKLTPLDVQAGYQCDECADKAERGEY
jgi:hypothetical protein